MSQHKALRVLLVKSFSREDTVAIIGEHGFENLRGALDQEDIAKVYEMSIATTKLLSDGPGRALRPVAKLADNLQDALEAFANRSACIVGFGWRNMFCTASVKLILRQSLCLTVNDDCSLLQLKVLDKTLNKEYRNP